MYPVLREMTWFDILVQIYKSRVKTKFKPVVCIYDADRPLSAEMFLVCLRCAYLFININIYIYIYIYIYIVT